MRDKHRRRDTAHPRAHASGPVGTTPISVPRLARHTFTLADGHRIGLAVSGRGVPLVVVHGFTAEGFLYAQTLHRLVNKGFKVIAIDMAGHGGTQGLPQTAARLGDYAELMHRTIAEAAASSRAVLAGHSMGGRVVAQMSAMHPEQVITTLLIDAIVGDRSGSCSSTCSASTRCCSVRSAGCSCSTRPPPCRCCRIRSRR